MIQPQTGSLLIADPFLKDANFSRTVVFLCEHEENGSFGLVINKALYITLDQVIPEVAIKEINLYYGGPVAMDTLHFLHQYPNLIPGSLKVGTGIYWGGNFAVLIQLLNNKEIDADKVRFYLGYSGWQKGQLHAEMEESKSWLTVMAPKKLIFHKELDKIWGEALTIMGGEYAAMKNYPIDPQLN
jgi:putative transcriptional regulator